MPPQVPGINISILRQSTTTRRGEPLLISGRVTALGFGIPALVRVFLNGPDFDPQIVTFDTFSSPVVGNYSVSILADKDGRYTVSTQAFPPFILPIPAGSPITPPALAESPSPPIIIGSPEGDGISVDTPDGRRFFAIPPPTPIEINTPIIIAPQIPITIGIPGAGPIVFPGAPVSMLPPDRPEELVITAIIQLPEEEEMPVGVTPVVSGEIVSLDLA